jgi:hypothetical protein
MRRKIILIGKNDIGFLDDGWYGLEKSPEGLFYRASSPEAWICIPDILTGQVSVSLILAARPEHCGHPIEVEILSDESHSFTFQLETNNWSTRSGVLDMGKSQKMAIKTHTPWSPDNLYKNGDMRSLGILLNAIRIEPLDSHAPQKETLWKSIRNHDT